MIRTSHVLGSHTQSHIFAHAVLHNHITRRWPARRPRAPPPTELALPLQSHTQPYLTYACPLSLLIEIEVEIELDIDVGS